MGRDGPAADAAGRWARRSNARLNAGVTGMELTTWAVQSGGERRRRHAAARMVRCAVERSGHAAARFVRAAMKRMSRRHAAAVAFVLVRSTRPAVTVVIGATRGRQHVTVVIARRHAAAAMEVVSAARERHAAAATRRGSSAVVGRGRMRSFFVAAIGD